LYNVAGIHWQVAQATSIQNVKIFMSDPSTSSQVGICSYLIGYYAKFVLIDTSGQRMEAVVGLTASCSTRAFTDFLAAISNTLLATCYFMGVKMG
jgi:hypothetical protein